MAVHDLPDMYALSPRAPGIHIRQIPHGHVTALIQANEIYALAVCI